LLFILLFLVSSQAQITIVSDHLKVVCKGEVVIDKRLYAQVDTVKSTYDVRKTKIEIILWKEDKGIWPTIEGTVTRPKTPKSESGKHCPKRVCQRGYLTENILNNSMRIFDGITHLIPYPYHLFPSLSHPAPQPTQQAQRMLHQQQQQWSRRGLRHTLLTRTGTLWGSE
jgi:CS domain